MQSVRRSWYTFVMDHRNRVREWLDNVRNAGFFPFEVSQPASTDSSLSGFGGNSYGRLHCGIAHTIDGREISIETIVDDTGSDYDFWIQRLVLGAVQSQLETDLTLPFTLNLTFEERSAEVLVEGTPVTFRGITGSGLDWHMRADIDSQTTVVIHGPAGSIAPTAIRRRGDFNLAGLEIDG